MILTTAQLDRAVGVLLGTAAGDALGAAYEFGPPRGPELEVAMVGGGSFGWEPGEWTDDTSMAIAIAEVAASGADLRDEKALDAIVTAGTSGRQQPKMLACKPVPSSEPQAGWASQRSDRPGGISSAAREHWPHRGQRLADAHRTTGTGLPRRRSRARGGGPCGQRADALRPRGR